MAQSFIETSFGNGVLASHPLLVIAASVVATFVALLITYPDRLVGTAPRKEIKTVAGAYPLIGNTIWILRILLKRVKLLDALSEIQNTEGAGGQPLTMTFPALGNRAIIINRPEYIYFCQKVRVRRSFGSLCRPFIILLLFANPLHLLKRLNLSTSLRESRSCAISAISSANMVSSLPMGTFGSVSGK